MPTPSMRTPHAILTTWPALFSGFVFFLFYFKMLIFFQKIVIRWQCEWRQWRQLHKQSQRWHHWWWERCWLRHQCIFFFLLFFLSFCLLFSIFFYTICFYRHPSQLATHPIQPASHPAQPIPASPPPFSAHLHRPCQRIAGAFVYLFIY